MTLQAMTKELISVIIYHHFDGSLYSRIHDQNSNIGVQTLVYFALVDGDSFDWLWLVVQLGHEAYDTAVYVSKTHEK